MRNYSFLYASFKPFVNWACRLFYRNLHVRDSHQVSKKDTPIILISNHQNALLDPLLCCITSPEQLNFLTRADVFKNPTAKKLLFQLNMLPVYRAHDRVNIKESNAPTFRESLNRLEKNQIMSLFPEGTHERSQNLMPFKKGAARIICDLLSAGYKSEVIIQPVGLHYTNIIHSGYPCFVKYGTQVQISAADLDLTEENRAKTILELTKKMNILLSKYVIHFPHGNEYYRQLFVFRVLQWSNLFSAEESSIPIFKELENLVPQHMPKVLNFTEKELKEIEYSSFDSAALVLAADSKLKKRFSIKLLALLPIYFIGFISTFIPYNLGKILSKKLVKDIHFTSTAKIVSGFLMIPVFWALSFIILSVFLPLLWCVLITLIMIITGSLFLKYHTSYRILARANSLRNNSRFKPLITKTKEILAIA